MPDAQNNNPALDRSFHLEKVLSNEKTTGSEIRQVAKSRFGYQDLRPGQETAITFSAEAPGHTWS